MKKVYLDINKLQEEGGDNVTLGNYSKIGIASTIKYSVTIGDCVSIGYSSTICHNSDIADDATIGNGIEILPRAKIKSGWTIKDIVHLRNEYRYHVSGYIINGTIIIQMGCFTRSLAEWENDFWNNDKEFKKGTPEGEQRLLAFSLLQEFLF